MYDQCYVTICTGIKYLKGVLLLNESLKLVNSIYPLICLVPSTIDKKTISCLHDKNIDIKIIENGIIINDNILKNNIQGVNEHWNKTFFKFYVFGLTEFKKIVFLDADMIIIKNIDELFEKPHLTACNAGGLYPGQEDWKGMNSGLMVIEPDKKITETLIDILNKIENISRGYGDQDIINKFYPDWYKQNELHLSEHYNLFYSYANYYGKKYGYTLDGDEPVRVIHFVGRIKPWMKETEIPLKWRIRKFLSLIKHYKEVLGYKTSLQSKIDEYYKKIEVLIGEL